MAEVTGIENASAGQIANEGAAATSEFSSGWRIVVASFFGIAIGLTALPFYTYGVFATPLQAEFGWSRGAVQLPMLFQTIGSLTALAYVGWAADKYGARPVALYSLCGYFIAFSCLSLIGSNIVQYYATAFFVGLLGAGTTPITWTKAINGAFNRNRGIALGLALMGTGATGFLAPPATNWFITEYGWRTAYLLLAAIPAVIGFPIVFAFFHEKKIQLSDVNAVVSGLPFKDAVLSVRFWIIALAFLVISFGIGGAIPNLFPLFTGQGFTPAKAAEILSLIGLSVIFGRLATGYLLDKFWAPAVAAGLMMLPAISCLLLVSVSSDLVPVYIATILLGLAAGAEFDIIAYLASRYFGLRNYSKIYSMLFAAFAIGASAAPAAFGFVFDKTGSYDAIFLISAGLFVGASATLLFLGKYPNFEDTPTDV